jgi:TonB family protein
MNRQHYVLICFVTARMLRRRRGRIHIGRICIGVGIACAVACKPEPKATNEATGDAAFIAAAIAAAATDTSACVLGFGVDRPVEIDSIARQILPYPEQLRRQAIVGHGRLMFVVDTGGRIDMNTIHDVGSTHRAFAEAAESSLRTARYRPAQLRGKPARCWAEQRFNFSPPE